MHSQFLSTSHSLCSEYLVVSGELYIRATMLTTMERLNVKVAFPMRNLEKKLTSERCLVGYAVEQRSCNLWMICTLYSSSIVPMSVVMHAAKKPINRTLNSSLVDQGCHSQGQIDRSLSSMSASNSVLHFDTALGNLVATCARARMAPNFAAGLSEMRRSLSTLISGSTSCCERGSTCNGLLPMQPYWLGSSN